MDRLSSGVRRVGGKILGLVLFIIPAVDGCYTLSWVGSIPHQRWMDLFGYGKRRRDGYGQMVKFIHFFIPMMRGGGSISLAKSKRRDSFTTTPTRTGKYWMRGGRWSVQVLARVLILVFSRTKILNESKKSSEWSSSLRPIVFTSFCIRTNNIPSV